MERVNLLKRHLCKLVTVTAKMLSGRISYGPGFRTCQDQYHLIQGDLPIRELGPIPAFRRLACSGFFFSFERLEPVTSRAEFLFFFCYFSLFHVFLLFSVMYKPQSS